MNNVTIRPEQFEAAVSEAIEQYGEDVFEVCEKAIKNASRGTARDLKASQPSGGAYAKGWTHKAQKGGRFKVSETVYNRLYMLTHLLEKPHTTGGGGHYPKNVDYTGTMKRAEEKHTKEYMEEVISKL